MNRSFALVPRLLAPIGAVAALILLAAAAPQAPAQAPAASPAVALNVDALLTPPSQAKTGHAPPSRLRLLATFGTNPPGAQLFTVQQAVILFPDRGTNGQLFPSCSAAQIQRFGGDTSRCPKGSKVGTGSVTAQIVPAGVAAAAQVLAFNSHHGRAVTFNFRSTKPAVINESFDAPLTLLHGGDYGAKLVMDVPKELQEVLPGLFVGLETFSLTLNAGITAHGSTYSYIEAALCPARYPMHGDFAFLDPATGQPAATVGTDAKLHCRVR